MVVLGGGGGGGRRLRTSYIAHVGTGIYCSHVQFRLIALDPNTHDNHVMSCTMYESKLVGSCDGHVGVLSKLVVLISLSFRSPVWAVPAMSEGHQNMGGDTVIAVPNVSGRAQCCSFLPRMVAFN